MRPNYRGMLIGACLLLAGCSSPPLMPAASTFAPVDDSPNVDPSFKLGLEILSGFDQPQTNADWQSDDWLLLGVKVDAANTKESNVWFVRLSTLPPKATPPTTSAPAASATQEFKIPFGIGSVKTGSTFTAPRGRLMVETYDRDGVLLRSSVRVVPQFRANASLFDICRSEPDAGADDSSCNDSDNHPLRADAPLMMMLETLGCAQALAPIREVVRHTVIKKPSILGFVFNGLRMNVDAQITESELVRSPWSPEAALTPRHEALFPVSLAGQHLFDCRMIVGPPDPPYNLTGGVLLLEAVHPEDTQNRLTIRVLAAKRLGGAHSNPPQQVATNAH